MTTLIAYLSLLVIACAGCTHVATVKKFDNVRANEALAFGRLRILRDGQEVTKYSSMQFNKAGSSSWNTASYVLTRGEVLCAALPAGDSYFFRIISTKGPFSSEYHYQFRPDEATLRMPQPGGAYYIGDITIDWTPPKSKSGKTAAFAAGMLYGGIVGGPILGLVGIGLLPYSGGEAVIAVQDNRTEAQKLFHEQFQTDKQLIPAFLQIRTTEKPEIGQKP